MSRSRRGRPERQRTKDRRARRARLAREREFASANSIQTKVDQYTKDFEAQQGRPPTQAELDAARVALTPAPPPPNITSTRGEAGALSDLSADERAVLEGLHNIFNTQVTSTFGTFYKAGELLPDGSIAKGGEQKTTGSYQKTQEEGVKQADILSNLVYGSTDESGNKTPGLFELTTPQMLQNAGYTGTVSPEGKLSGVHLMTDQERLDKMDPLQRKNYELAIATTDRQMAAVKGELPPDAALMKDLGDQEALMREALSRRLGPGYEGTSVGQQTLQKFNEGRSRILDTARHGELAQGSQAVSEAVGRTSGLQNQATQGLFNTYQFTPPQTAPILAGAYNNANAVGAGAQGAGGQLLSGYGEAMNPILSLYGINRQAQAQRDANRSSGLGSLVSGIVTLGAAYLTGGASLPFVNPGTIGAATSSFGGGGSNYNVGDTNLRTGY